MLSAFRVIVAEDGDGANGTYTSALLAQIEEHGVPIEQALKRVTVRVKNATKGKQEPWMEGSLTGDFYFVIHGPTQITIQPAPPDADTAAWQAAETAKTAAAYQAYLTEYPKGVYAAAVRINLAGLSSAKPSSAGPVATPAAAARPPGEESVLDRDAALWQEVKAAGSKTHCEAYVREFPRGKYAPMARAELKRLTAEEAEQRAQVERQAWERARQVDTGQFRKFVEATAYLTEAERPARSPGCHIARSGGEFVLERTANWRSPGFAQTDSHPVVCVSCSDAQAFTSSGGYFGRNGFSLYDMIGNVAEWTQDCWNPDHGGAPVDGKARSSGDCTQRVVRGGSWSSSPVHARSAARQKNVSSYRAADLGFRLARSPS